MKDESTELNTQTGETPSFFGDLAGVLGTTAAIGAVGLKAQEQTQAKEIKSKILSRIQRQLNKEPGAEGLIYMRNVQYDKGQVHLKGPAPIQPID